MKYEVLKSKIHSATITETSLEYEGSIEIDEDIMKAAGIKEY
jgi:aspartate 1-decarboxylase